MKNDRVRQSAHQYMTEYRSVEATFREKDTMPQITQTE